MAANVMPRSQDSNPLESMPRMPPVGRFVPLRPRPMRKDSVPQYFPVLKLPAEIRNRIWRSAVVVSEMVELKAPIDGPGDGVSFFQNSKARNSVYPLAAACHQVYKEVTAIYYTHNTFAVLLAPRQACEPDITRFLATLRHGNHLYITSLSLFILFPVHIHWHDLEWRVFRRLPRLRKLELNLPSSEDQLHQKRRLERMCEGRLTPSFSFRSYRPRRAPEDDTTWLV